jgi:hypothetical protein
MGKNQHVVPVDGEWGVRGKGNDWVIRDSFIQAQRESKCVLGMMQSCF